MYFCMLYLIVFPYSNLPLEVVLKNFKILNFSKNRIFVFKIPKIYIFGISFIFCIVSICMANVSIKSKYYLSHLLLMLNFEMLDFDTI